MLTRHQVVRGENYTLTNGLQIFPLPFKEKRSKTENIQLTRSLLPTLGSKPLCLVEYDFSAGNRKRHAKPVGGSEPSVILCDRTVPVPYGDTSQASCRGNFGSTVYLK
ncbi:hypothetical protein XENOCAPTIV_005418 [Xenoophorus captivus]|uniref:Uncharacterized protein n=1 Tax=Xenoophorus captivus TaxID=1517983 RepID=A0ABV0RK45_9TELE